MAQTRPFFSVVIPCYNDGRYAPGMYIDRLLANLVDQGLKKDQLEVIIADDHSPIPYQGTLDRYSDKLNIKFVVTDYNFGPGNTRQKGADAATGEWLCFADHDDIFYPGALKSVKLKINRNKEQYIVYSYFNKVDSEDTSKIIEEFNNSKNLTTWVHGKFYNVDNFWKPYNIHFLKDLKSHEDIAIGKFVECAMHNLNIQPMLVDEPVYMWTFNKDSISNRNYVTKVDQDGVAREFLETDFADNLRCQTDPFFECLDNNIITPQEFMGLMLGSFASCWNLLCIFKKQHPDNYIKENDAYCSRVWDRFKTAIKQSKAAIKVLLKVNFDGLIKQLDEIAEKFGQSEFLDWLDEIDAMDYASVLDGAEAAKIREINQQTEVATEEGSDRPFYSIVIACYNDGRYKEGVYLDRLLASITRQDLPRGEIEVILSDDCSPKPFDHIIAKYEKDLLIKYIKTDYNFAPGNTRAKGVTIATGRWLCFADHDDIFYDNALVKMKNAILEKNEQHFAFGDFYGVNPEGEVIRKYECHLNWCHGKFYNKDNFWDKYDIHFIHDLKSHEDIAICTQVSCVLASYIKDYTYLHSAIYAWTDNPQSVSHAKYTVDTETGPREFLEVFYGDYIQSTGYIYISKFKDGKVKMANAIKGVLEIMCYCYFYQQGFMFRRPDDYYKKNLELAGAFVTDAKKTFNMTNQSMYNAIASNHAFMYYQINELANGASGHYIPTLTLRQWLDQISPDLPNEEKKEDKPVETT